jgi:HPt (histidine-containing phosphotransfer) domain-containing protein
MNTSYQYINLNYLNELSDGDHEFMRDMIQTFLDNVPSYIHDFRTLKFNKDHAGMQSFAHKMKATFLFMGIESLSKDSANIELQCKQGTNDTEVELLLNKMEPQFILVVRELQDALKNIS